MVSPDGKRPSAVMDESAVASRIMMYAGAVEDFNITFVVKDECKLTEETKRFIEAVQHWG